MQQAQGHRSGRGGGRGGHGGRGGGHVHDKPKKEAILNLAKYVDKQIRVKFMGNREGTLYWHLIAVVGTLKGYDQPVSYTHLRAHET